MRAESASDHTQQAKWIFGPSLDWAFFLTPVLVGAFGLLAPGAAKPVNGWHSGWLVLAVTLVTDKGHLIGTAFRTYLDPKELLKRPFFYVVCPLLYWLVGFFVYGAEPLWFWRMLTYFGIFHLVRQQYGWMMYANGPGRARWAIQVDRIFIYMACLLPLAILHTRNESGRMGFLVEGDLLSLPAGWAGPIESAFWITLTGYVGVACVRGVRERMPKILVLASSGLCFYFYFCYFAAPLVSLVMPLLHGLPYLTLVYSFERRYWGDSAGWRGSIYRGRGWLIFLVCIAIGGLIEASLTTGFLPTQTANFQWSLLSNVRLSDRQLAICVPVLTYLTFFHFVTDGFLWRRGKGARS